MFIVPFTKRCPKDPVETVVISSNEPVPLELIFPEAVTCVIAFLPNWIVEPVITVSVVGLPNMVPESTNNAFAPDNLYPVPLVFAS